MLILQLNGPWTGGFWLMDAVFYVKEDIKQQQQPSAKNEHLGEQKAEAGAFSAPRRAPTLYVAFHGSGAR